MIYKYVILVRKGGDWNIAQLCTTEKTAKIEMEYAEKYSDVTALYELKEVKK